MRQVLRVQFYLRIMIWHDCEVGVFVLEDEINFPATETSTADSLWMLIPIIVVPDILASLTMFCFTSFVCGSCLYWSVKHWDTLICFYLKFSICFSPFYECRLGKHLLKHDKAPEGSLITLESLFSCPLSTSESKPRRLSCCLSLYHNFI